MKARATTWRTCKCGRPFRARMYDACEDCRAGLRAGILRHRMMLQTMPGRRAMRRLWKGVAR